ncbi:unnamed protein product [Gongylonema pulchrum]|uniref:AAA domain-containing protein n=1 Tax=Gongylonema pulchrum TaxID=637853 RepID=A0A183ED82_9BILA|nr:unnamed protein product [Gongylonema pulchrum]
MSQGCAAEAVSGVLVSAASPVQAECCELGIFRIHTSKKLKFVISKAESQRSFVTSKTDTYEPSVSTSVADCIPKKSCISAGTPFKRIVPPIVKLIPMSPVESPAASHPENCAIERPEQVQCPSRKGVRKKSNSSLKQNRSGKKHLCTSSNQAKSSSSKGTRTREEATVPDTIDACGREQSEKSVLTDPVAPMGSQNSTANSKHTTDKLPVEKEQLANTESAAKDTADQMATHGDAKVALGLLSGLAGGQQKAGKSAGGQVKGQKSSSSSEEEEDEEEASTESRHLPVQLVRRSSEEGFHQVVKFTKHAAQRLKATAAKPKQIISSKNEKKSEQATKKEQNFPVTEEEAKNQCRRKSDGLDEKSDCTKIMPELHASTETSFDKSSTPVDTAPFDARGITGNQTFLDRFPDGQNEADASLKEPCNKQKRQQPNPEEVTCSDSKTLV